MSRPQQHKQEEMYLIYYNYSPKFAEEATKIICDLEPNQLIFHLEQNLLHFVAFFHVASLILYRVDNRKVGVDNKKALELTNSTVFHRGRQ